MPGSTVVSPRIPASFWPLALLGFAVPSATIFQTLAVAWQLSQTGAIASVLPTMVALGAATRIASGIPLGHWVKTNGANASCFMALWIEVCVLLGMGIVLSGIGSIWLLVPLEMASALAVTGFLISRQTLLKEMLAQSNGREAASGSTAPCNMPASLFCPLSAGACSSSSMPTRHCCAVRPCWRSARFSSDQAFSGANPVARILPGRRISSVEFARPCHFIAEAPRHWTR